jgi:hypothetical protein
VWDWTRKKRLNYFYNGNPRGTSITSLHIINQEVGAMIVSASGEHYPGLIYVRYAETLQPKGLSVYTVTTTPTLGMAPCRWLARSER